MKNIVYVFIDASNLWQAQKVKSRFFDLEKLKRYLIENHNATDMMVYYYTAYPKNGSRNYDLAGKHKFFTYLKKGLGFVVRKKELKQIRTMSADGERIEEKGNMDVEMTIDAVNLVNRYSCAVLFTGDSDFLALVSYIRNRKKKVFIYSSQNNISSELRTGGDGYVDVLKITKDIWGKKISHRSQNKTTLD